MASATTQILLADYMDSLASLPNELTRAFSDLRELDAVLRTSIESITRKILLLISLIETDSIAPAERLNLLLEIAHDAQHLKMGTEDKIRVSGKACEELTITRRQVDSILGQITTDVPHFSDTLHVHSTTYPHVAPESLRPVHVDHNGRRKRVPGGAGLIARDSYSQVTPVKKRRVDDDVSSIRNGVAPGRAGPKPKVPTTVTAVAPARAKPKIINEPGSPTSIEFANAPYRGTNNNSRNAGARPAAAGVAKQNGSANGRGRLTSRDEGAAARRAGTNLLDMVASRGSGRNAFDDDDYASSVAPSARRGGSPVQEDTVVDYRNGFSNGGAGHQPSARAAASRSRATVAAAAADEYDFENETQMYDDDQDPLEDPGDIQGDPDEKRYCYCNRISFGQMVGCDDDSCEKEWFHLVCIGHRVAPTGTWYCDDCRIKHQPKQRAKARPGAKAGGGVGSGAGTGAGGGKRPKARGGSTSNAGKDKENNGSTGPSNGGGGGRGTGKRDTETATTKSKSKSASPEPEPTPAPAAENEDDEPDNADSTHQPVKAPTDPHGVDAEAEIAAKIEAIDEITEIDASAKDQDGVSVPRTYQEEPDLGAVPSADADADVSADADAGGDVSMTDGTESIPIDPALSGIPIAV